MAGDTPGERQSARASWVSWPEGSMGGIVGLAPGVGLVFSFIFQHWLGIARPHWSAHQAERGCTKCALAAPLAARAARTKAWVPAPRWSRSL